MQSKPTGEIQIYRIPNNFIEGGRVLNGLFKTRNLIEAVAVGGIFTLIALAIPTASVRGRITLVVSFALPWVSLCLTGINGDSFITFVSLALKWRKSKAVMFLDDAVHPYAQSPVVSMMAAETPRDKLIGQIVTASERRKDRKMLQRKRQVYQFAPDTEQQRFAEKTVRQESSTDITDIPEAEIDITPELNLKSQSQSNNFSIDFGIEGEDLF